MEDTQVFYGMGNHDLVKGGYGEELFEKIYGPTFYSFEVGNIHYVMTPMLHGDYSPYYTKEDVYHWLKNDLAHTDKRKSVIVFNHSISEDTLSFKYGISDTEYIDLPAAGLKAWLYGHWHVNQMYRHEPTGVYTICTPSPACGGIDHALSSFRVLTVDAKGGLTSELRYSYLSPFCISCHWKMGRYLCCLRAVSPYLLMLIIQHRQYVLYAIGVNMRDEKSYRISFGTSK